MESFEVVSGDTCESWYHQNVRVHERKKRLVFGNHYYHEYKGKDVQLNKPKRGGPKKYYVYVKNPKTGNVKKINFGDAGGLTAKINDPDAVRSFVARHDCKNKNDKTKAGYWACRLPRYGKSLGLKGGGAWW